MPTTQLSSHVCSGIGTMHSVLGRAAKNENDFGSVLCRRRVTCPHWQQKGALHDHPLDGRVRGRPGDEGHEAETDRSSKPSQEEEEEEEEEAKKIEQQKIIGDETRRGQDMMEERLN